MAEVTATGRLHRARVARRERRPGQPRISSAATAWPDLDCRPGVRRRGAGSLAQDRSARAQGRVD